MGGYLYIKDSRTSGNTGMSIEINPNGTSFTGHNSDYVFNVSKDGNLVMGVTNKGDGYFKGQITATSGDIACWKIDKNAIWKDSSNIIDSNNAFGLASTMYFGNKGISITDKFKVSSSGVIEAEGKITATSGKIGNWFISGNRIKTSEAISIGSKEAGMLLINELDKPFIHIQDASGNTKFNVSRSGVVTGSDLRAENTLYIGNTITVNNVKKDVFEPVALITSWSSNIFGVKVGLPRMGSNIEFEYGLDNSGAIEYSLINIIGETMDVNPDTIFHSSLEVNHGGSYSHIGLDDNANYPLSLLCGYEYAVKIGEGFNPGNTIFAPCTSDGDAATEKVYLGANQSRWITCFTKNPLNTSSDERDKNIFDIDKKYLDFYMKLKPISFTWKDDEEQLIHMGFGAQTTEQIALSCGIEKDKFAGISHSYWDKSDETGRNDSYSMSYNEILMLTVPFVQDHEYRINKLEEKINKLEQENKLLKESMK